jgi:NAD(P)-dependent dehydrogenase (short-subunit alcohol dehydrogenase family)
MSAMTYTSALIVGAGSGLSASLARAFAKAGMRVALAARAPDKLAKLAQETGAETYACDASDRAQVDKMFTALEADGGAPEVVVYNASYRTRGPFIDLDPVEVEKAIAVTAFGGFLVAQA